MTKHDLWSDEELDRALNNLHSTVDTDERRLDEARAELMTAAAAPATRHRRRWAVAAAAVLVLIAGLLVTQAIPLGGGPPTASAAAQVLNSAADKIGASDPPVGPGQYRYIATRAWGLTTHSAVTHSAPGAPPAPDIPTWSYLEEGLSETWVPADQSQEWLARSDTTGARKWVEGTEEQARANGWDPDGPGRPQGEWKARCGDFFAADEGKQPCTDPGSWQTPTPQWLAELPRDPQQLYDRLAADAPDNSLGDAELLVYAADALRGGLVPADVRAALYRALAKLPGLEITDRLANLDGRTGVAFGMTDPYSRNEIIIDPSTGEFIGERRTTLHADGGLPAGTVASYSSVTTAVVDSMGARPAG